MSWCLKAESHTGIIHILRRGFKSEDEALDHKTIAKHWRRIWAEPDKTGRRGEPEPVDAPTPWRIVWEGGNASIFDAKGHRVAFFAGKKEQQLAAAEVMADLLMTAQQAAA